MKRQFDISFLHTDSERRERHGYPWEKHEFDELRRLFRMETSLQYICSSMKRSAAGVLPKLKGLGLIAYSSSDDCYYRVTQPEPGASGATNPNPETKEEIMLKINVPAAATIETKTFIAGVDASTLTDEQIFTRIAEIESQLRHYDTISTKPAKLVELMSRLKLDTAKLAAYVDGRE